MRLHKAGKEYGVGKSVFNNPRIGAFDVAVATDRDDFAIRDGNCI